MNIILVLILYSFLTLSFTEIINPPFLDQIKKKKLITIIAQNSFHREISFFVQILIRLIRN